MKLSKWFHVYGKGKEVCCEEVNPYKELKDWLGLKKQSYREMIQDCSPADNGTAIYARTMYDCYDSLLRKIDEIEKCNIAD